MVNTSAIAIGMVNMIVVDMITPKMSLFCLINFLNIDIYFNQLVTYTIPRLCACILSAAAKFRL